LKLVTRIEGDDAANMLSRMETEMRSEHEARELSRRTKRQNDVLQRVRA